MNREELIEKLRGLRRSAVHALSADDVMTIDHAISVFEQAYTPTDDEREWLVGFFLGAGVAPHLAGRYAIDLLDTGFHRTIQNEPTVEEWAARAHAAREKAIAKGYTPDHDAEHGIRHLLNWAIDYARRGRPEDSAGLILSGLALLDEPQGWVLPPRRSDAMLAPSP